MKQFFWLALVFVTTQLLIGAPLLEQDYSAAAGELSGAPAGVTHMALPEGGACLQLDATVSSFELATVEVKPETKYRLVLRARVQGPLTIEQNDRAHIQAIQRRGRSESVYNIEFQEPGLPKPSSGGGGFFLTREWYDYVHVFRTPAGVEKVTIQLTPRKHVTQIARVSLVTDDEGGAINNNPDFRYGELNYCGWAPQRDGSILLRPDGKHVFRSGYGGSSPRFPLQEGRFYRMAGRGEGGSLTIYYFDADNKSIASRFLLRFPEVAGEASAELTPPDGCVSASVTAYGALIESFKVAEREEQ